MQDTQRPDAAVPGNDGCAGGSTFGTARAASPPLLHLALETDPGYHLARLSELMISSGSVAMSCRSPRIPA